MTVIHRIEKSCKPGNPDRGKELEQLRKAAAPTPLPSAANNAQAVRA